MTSTHTTTYTRTTPADPYLACAECGARVVSWLDRPGRTSADPCGHDLDYRSTCPSWSPVTGCRCVELLGARPDGHLPDPDLRMVWVDGTRWGLGHLRQLVTLPDDRTTWTIDDPHAEAMRLAYAELGIPSEVGDRTEVWPWPPPDAAHTLQPAWYAPDSRDGA